MMNNNNNNNNNNINIPPTAIICPELENEEVIKNIYNLQHLSKITICNYNAKDYSREAFHFILIKEPILLKNTYNNSDSLARKYAAEIFDIPIENIPKQYRFYWWLKGTNRYVNAPSFIPLQIFAHNQYLVSIPVIEKLFKREKIVF